MDAEYGEVEMSGRVAGKTFHNFRLLDSVEDADNADFRHGEITVPADFLSSYSDAKGIHIRIPYTPDNRLLTVRIAMESGSGGIVLSEKEGNTIFAATTIATITAQ